MFLAVSDTAVIGVVTSMARPAQNVTGLSILAPELEGKRLELLNESLPKINRVGVLFLAAALRVTAERR